MNKRFCFICKKCVKEKMYRMLFLEWFTGIKVNKNEEGNHMVCQKCFRVIEKEMKKQNLI